MENSSETENRTSLCLCKIWLLMFLNSPRLAHTVWLNPHFSCYPSSCWNNDWQASRHHICHYRQRGCHAIALSLKTCILVYYNVGVICSSLLTENKFSIFRHFVYPKQYSTVLQALNVYFRTSTASITGQNWFEILLHSNKYYLLLYGCKNSKQTAMI